MERIKFDFDLIEKRFKNLELNRKNAINEITLNVTKIELSIKSVELEQIQRRLNDVRQQLISNIEHSREEKLAVLNSNRLVEFKTSEKIPNILGKIRIENEFCLLKKIYYIDLYDFLNEVKLMNESNSDYRLIDVIFISSNVVFYHFKSSDYHDDKLVQSDERLRQTIMHYDGIGFSKYLTTNGRILACLNDFKNKYHALSVYDRDFNLVISREFDSTLSLSLANVDEIVCYVPHEYLVLNYQLEIVDSFSKSLELVGDLNKGQFVILSDSSRQFFYFKVIDEPTKKIFIKVVDKVNHSRVRLIEIDVDEFFKASYYEDILYIKNIYSPKIRVVDVKNGTEFSRHSNQLRNFYFVSISQDDRLYSVNYFSNKIVYI